MPEDKELIRKRASYKGQLTAFSRYLNALKVPSLGPAEVNELQFRHNRIQSMYAQYDEVQLLLECSTDTIDSQIDERTEFESLYYKALAQSQKILSDCTKADRAESDSGSRSSTHKFVKLPTIQLPKFSGSYDNWLEFHDTFASLIHANDEIDDINKYHYLRASLEGSAAVVIQSIEFSAANYRVAWKLLCDRFDNKRLLIQNHVAALFNIQSISKESSLNLKRLIDQINKNLRALESLGEPTKSWDTLLIYIMTRKLDAKTYREWEESKGLLDKDTKVTFDLFLKFVKNRADLVETLEMSSSTVPNHSTSSNKTNPKVKALVSVQDQDNQKATSAAVSSKPCPKCTGDHKLISCPQFLALTNESRLQLLPTYKICFNCFNSGHYANHCKKPGCKICRRKHNTLVHITEPKSKLFTDCITASVDNNNMRRGLPPPPRPEPVHSANLSLSASVAASPRSERVDVLLSTALIQVYDSDNRKHIARAVLDSGSTSCFITEQMYQRLRLPTISVDGSVMGVGNVTSPINKICDLQIMSLNDSFKINIKCFILPLITDYVPSKQINLENLKIPSNICLADPNFYSPAAVDILIGADVFWDLLGTQRIKLAEGQPILCETRLGWLVSGSINSRIMSESTYIKCNFTQVTAENPVDSFNNQIQNQLTRFWNLEEIGSRSAYSQEEKSCEEHFVTNTTRMENGRFCVKIPLKQSPDVLGDSFPRAKQCFLSLERRFRNNPKLGDMYKNFLKEYESLGHMSKCQNPYLLSDAHYIPHHGVLRDSSTTTKLRVVFNASSPTTSGVCFNSIQMVGPVVQDDLLSILLRFRQHRYIIAADVEKMYRQIAVHPDDRYLQQIIWRDNPSAPLQAYRLNTVTYGTASAPFLATRCIKQLGLECADHKVSEVIQHDMYVDDLLSGGDDLIEVQDLRQKVTWVLASAQMFLRKWKSNHIQLMTENNLPSSSVDLNIGTLEASRTLGLGWQPQSDLLHFPISPPIASTTKRDMLSIISQIFDPLGLLAPCVISMKMLLQRLWLHKLSWDEQLSLDISKLWTDILIDLPQLNKIRIPRHIICELHHYLEFHIFTDASERAYGACMYVRSVANSGEVTVRLLLAKSRVAPLKPTIFGPLRAEELDLALVVILRASQNESFSEYKVLINNHNLPPKSPLLKFNVFLDHNKVMRVGGRLKHANFSYSKKHPILIQSTHRFTKLLFNFEHRRLLHAGPQLLLATIRETYWPIRGRNLARFCYRQCVKCCRMKGQTVTPIMGDLPQQRITGGFPFESVGIDYAGPIRAVTRQGRGCQVVKVYIAVFVCFTTKSMHLELVGDLTSNTFILALRRFMSRRGKPANIFSDNGTSFVGAYNDISKFLKDNCDSLSETMATEGIKFHFIPAYSPHFAGLAEAGVKSTKYHLVRVLGHCHLSYEELNTTLVQIEAILNSRPLTPLSSNPEDLTPLTPGHFLIGRPLTSLPSPDYQERSTSSLTRFQRIEQLRQHFWARWSKEYISELQIRTKWRTCKGSLQLNSLVLLKEDNVPPLKWKLGRIVAVHPGTDGVTRVADVRTASGLVRRSFCKICPLPKPEDSC